MKHVALAILLLLSSAAFAQTTTFSGTISDLTGTPVTSGQVTFALKPSVDSTISGVARFTPQTVTCGIDGTGALKNQALSGACVVTSNTSLTPVGTYYKVTVCPAFACGPAFNTFALGGATDITTVVPTPGTSPANMFLDLMSTQTITGAKTFNNAANSFSGTFAGTIAASSVTSSSTISSVGAATIGGTITAGSAAHQITTAAGLVDLAQTSGTLAASHGGTGAALSGVTGSGTLLVTNTAPAIAAPVISGQLTLSQSTGTAPLLVTSTTPVANLTAGPTAYSQTGTQIVNYHIVRLDSFALTAGSATVTLSGAAVFTGPASYACVFTDETSASSLKFTRSSGSSFTVTGTGTDTVSGICGGN